MVQDKEALVGLNKELSRLLNEMQQQKPLEDGLVVEAKNVKKCQVRQAPLKRDVKLLFQKERLKANTVGEWEKGRNVS